MHTRRGNLYVGRLRRLELFKSKDEQPSQTAPPAQATTKPAPATGSRKQPWRWPKWSRVQSTTVVSVSFLLLAAYLCCCYTHGTVLDYMFAENKDYPNVSVLVNGFYTSEQLNTAFGNHYKQLKDVEQGKYSQDQQAKVARCNQHWLQFVWDCNDFRRENRDGFLQMTDEHPFRKENCSTVLAHQVKFQFQYVNQFVAMYNMTSNTTWHLPVATLANLCIHCWFGCTWTEFGRTMGVWALTNQRTLQWVQWLVPIPITPYYKGMIYLTVVSSLHDKWKTIWDALLLVLSYLMDPSQFLEKPLIATACFSLGSLVAVLQSMPLQGKRFLFSSGFVLTLQFLLAVDEARGVVVGLVGYVWKGNDLSQGIFCLRMALVSLSMLVLHWESGNLPRVFVADALFYWFCLFPLEKAAYNLPILAQQQ